MGRVRPRRALLLAATTLVGSLALSEAAIWDGLFGGNNNNNNNNNNQQQAPPPPPPPVVTEPLPPAIGRPTPPLIVEPPLPPPPKKADDNLTPPPGLDMKGVDPHSLITRTAAAHPIPAGQCGVYTRESETQGDTPQIAICIESIIEYGTDLKQMNGFLVNTGNVALCDLLIQPAVPSGSILRSFWPDWALENLQDIYIDPGQVTSLGLTLRPERADPNELPRVDVWAFKDCSQSVYDAATGVVTFELVPIQDIMPLEQVVEVFAEGGNKAAADMGAGAGAAAGVAAVANGALLQEGECAIYSKPGLLAADIEAQATLCIESVIRWGNQIVQVNGLMLNTGKSPLCSVRLAFEKESSYFSVWPRWAMMGRWRDDFQPGEAIAVGFSAPGRSDGTFPAMALDNFDVCGRVDSDGLSAGSPVEVVIVNMDDLLGNPDPKDINKAAEHDAQVADTSAGTKTDMSASIPAQTAIPAGTCGVYRKGAAELSLCSESLVHWGKDVQQLNGFMMNTGSVTICDIKLKPALASGETYSLWPDWAQEGAYEVFFNPKQLTAVGMTGPITDTTPYMEIVSFRDCKAPARAALDPITSFSTVQIETIQVPNASEELVSIPTVPIPTNIGAKQKLRRAQAVAAGVPMPVAPPVLPPLEEVVGEVEEVGENAIPQGHCALYTIGTGVLALCIESVIHWGVDLTQVNAYLENVSIEPLCQISVALSGSPRGYESIWPKWVQEGTYPGMFKPGQVSPIGLVAPYEATMPNPSIVVESFSLCAKVINATPKPVEIVRIGDLKHVDVGGLPMGRPDYVPEIAAVAETIAQRMDAPDKAGLGAGAIPSPPVQQQAPPQQQAQAQTQAAPEPPQGVATRPGRCSQASAGLFNMHVKFCVDQTQMWSDDVLQMSGQIENTGDSAICDLRLGHNFEKAAVATVWPQWSLAGAAFSKPFLPGDKINVGLTANPKGLKAGEEDPSLSVVSFRPCASNKVVALEQVWEGPMAEKVVDLLHPGVGVVTTEEEDHPTTEEGRRRLAMKNGAKPTTMDTINWDLCGYYTGKDGKSELALCWKDAKSWKDKDAGRVVQTNLILVNTGKFGVCNVTVEIENIDQELGDHYPTNWLDEDGDDIFPSYPGYYAPEQIVNMGAAVPVASGFPEVGISADFTACDAPPPKVTPPRKADCVVKKNDAGVELNFCLYSKPKVWTEYDGPRVVMVEGYIENIGKETACNIEVYIENFANNQAKWGEWMPKFPYKLSPGASLKFGANIPMKKGIPKSDIKTFDRCDPLEERRRM